MKSSYCLYFYKICFWSTFFLYVQECGPQKNWQFKKREESVTKKTINHKKCRLFPTCSDKPWINHDKSLYHIDEISSKHMLSLARPTIFLIQNHSKWFETTIFCWENPCPKSWSILDTRQKTFHVPFLAGCIVDLPSGNLT